MVSTADVTALVPAYNEAATVGSVVDGLHDEGIEDVLVVDGGSADETVAVAEEHGARVIVQSGSGKGQAVREGVDAIENPYVLLLDADGTNPPEQAGRLLDPLLAGDADHVIGDRTAEMEENAMTALNQVGNRLINGAFRYIHGHDYVDILSGYRAFTRESFEKSHLTADGFGIETEMAVECARHGYTVEVVPTTYRARPDESETNLHPLKDGGRIILTLYQLTKTNNPLFYFGSVGVASTLAGLLLGGYVAYEWFVLRVSHEVIALLGAAGILFGVQLLIFGVLSDLIVTLHREQLRRLERLEAKEEEN
ncbi:S-layer glycoprotein N-glycosyltransferase AglJ [Halocalculus aciditolerans]|uniref:Glycosyltransferase, TIGR04182 family n=1 Tax=Halocalculus aciditolerans TaxID=1383812 RepID=A0A830FIL8_9EURY|nr:S-layer glycoprotein N-glycosyltransferase AglJ [Halocalculus aciditolerans]GGL58665.1 glycosyltransferase, TIGR04182 family [Halocalculus aciditolerans]